MGSGLTLSDELLTARTIATASLPRTRLVALSACETELVDTEQPEYEYVGLAGAFLHAGAASILSPLWTVTTKFDSGADVRILRTAHQRTRRTGKRASERQLAVRKRKKFDEPFYLGGLPTRRHLTSVRRRATRG